MGSLQLVLKNGFAGDAVRIQVNGRTVVDEAAVTTKPQLELALMRDLQVEGASAEVAVAVPSRGAAATFVVALADVASLEISVTASNAIEHRTSRHTARVL